MKKKLNNKGFTIIEVLIVLAIAGLILLIVFLAVPALQRNSRNNSRRADASAILAAVNEYINNNNGSNPNGICSAANSGSVTLGATGSPGYTPASAKLGYYTKAGLIGTVANGTCTTAAAFTPVAAGSPGLSNVLPYTFAGTGVAGDKVMIVPGATCDNATVTAQGSSQPTFQVVAGTTRQNAVLYMIESGTNSRSIKCIST